MSTKLTIDDYLHYVNSGLKNRQDNTNWMSDSNEKKI